MLRPIRPCWQRTTMTLLFIMALGFTMVVPTQTEAAPGRLYCPESVYRGTTVVCEFRASGLTAQTVYQVSYWWMASGPPTVTVDPQSRLGYIFVRVGSPPGGSVTVKDHHSDVSRFISAYIMP